MSDKSATVASESTGIITQSAERKPKQQKQQQPREQQHPQSQSGAHPSAGQADKPPHQQQQQGHKGERSSVVSQSSASGKPPQGQAQVSSTGPAGKGSVVASASGTAPVAASVHRLAMFDHLARTLLPASISEQSPLLHPSTIKLGLMTKKGAIYDDDERVSALILALSNVIESYSTPANKSLSWDLDKHIKTQVRPLLLHGNITLSISYPR
jgi:hypothetical protein